uniref:F-box/FBD/LRR-repeat protein At2g04230-like n=1 Tax=Erigeron canadensis TaxID=72917 RepID=UPI001CB97638|nr:F-box/FBD/LRR-repeat protein At2g04230-like [Erigeron canadensis]
MDDRRIIRSEKDRLSSLPVELKHTILSYLELKDVVQTSAYSREWRYTWTAMPHLKLNSSQFPSMSVFSKFVKDNLSSICDNPMEVSAIDLTFKGAATRLSVKSVVEYAYMRNVSQLTLTRISRKLHQFPGYLFSASQLKHLTLATTCQSFYLQYASSIPKVDWDFPELETLVLKNMHLGDATDGNLNLFSKCTKLKDLTLHKCCMFGLDIFNICAPELCNLTIIEGISFPNVCNVVAPKLKNLITSVRASVDRVPVAFDSLILASEGLDSLENVNLSFSMPVVNKERFIPVLLNLFQTLHNAKYLTIETDIIEILSMWPGQISLGPCPFERLEHLKINKTPLKKRDSITTVNAEVRNYFLGNSPAGATFIMDLPQDMIVS